LIVVGFSREDLQPIVKSAPKISATGMTLRGHTISTPSKNYFRRSRSPGMSLCLSPSSTSAAKDLLVWHGRPTHEHLRFLYLR
jgi:hypothetical protein